MAAARRGRGHSRLRQFFPDLCEAGLHLRARAGVRQQPARLAGNASPRSSGSASARGPPRARQSGSPSNKTAPAPAAFPPSSSAASPCKRSPWGFPKAPLPPSPSRWRPAPGRRGPWRPSFPLQSLEPASGPCAPEKKRPRSWPRPAGSDSTPAPGKAARRRPEPRANGARPRRGGSRAVPLLMDGPRPARVSEKTPRG